MSTPRTPRSLLPAAEVALAFVTIAAVLSFRRLFEDGSYFVPLFVVAVTAHLVITATRRLGWSLGLSALGSLVAMALSLTWVFYGYTTSWLLPTRLTLGEAGDDLSEAWRLFQDVRAPTATTTGFLLAAGAALWVAVFIADWAAFRLWVPFEAVVPAGTLFVFTSMLGTSVQRVTVTIVFAGAVLGFILVHRVARQQATSSWLVHDVDRGSSSLLRAGAGLIVLSVIAGAVIGPQLPGADAEPLVAWRGIGKGEGTRQTISPLVEIRGRLVSQSSTELFTVESDVRSYWRLTALDVFDGSVWSSRGAYDDADEDLPSTYTSNADPVIATQEFRIRQLAAIWAPAAFVPRSLESDTFDLNWEPESSTLIVARDHDSSDGARYVVQSAIPQFDAAALAAVGDAPVPDAIAERYLALPEGFPDRVIDEAERVAADASTPYEKAMALQGYFRGGNFEYNLVNTPGGHGDSVIEEFLFDVRSGYCEQFAATYAAMARAVGLPSRVAVGFTPGDADTIEPNLYHVRGLHAHAWPEVFISGYGWVPFEPTPTRGAPGAAYTGVTEEQANTDDPSTATTVAASGTDDGLGSNNDPGLVPDEGLDGLDSGGGIGALGGEDSIWEQLLPALSVGLAVIGALAALYVLIVPGGWLLLRWVRRRRAVQPADKVRLAWTEGTEAMSVLGVRHRSSDTPAEYAARAGRTLGTRDWDALASSVALADFSAEGVGREEADKAWSALHEISSDVHQKAGWRDRLRAVLRPSRLRRIEPDDGFGDGGRSSGRRAMVRR